MQQQLDGLREQLTESQRLATIGTIAAGIAHELLNLLINARHALLGGKGGSITVKAGRGGDAADDAEAPEVRLQVIDTGPGIPEKHLGKIFQPFFTTKGTAPRGESKGTGLGLAI